MLVNRSTRITDELLSDPGCLKLIIARSSGFDHINVEKAEERGVCVAK